MDLDVQVAKLRLLKSSHQSQKHQLEDRLIPVSYTHLESPLPYGIEAGKEASLTQCVTPCRQYAS